MLQDIRIPEIGESIESGEVVSVLVSVGDIISVDQPLAELETDKAVLELPSPMAGKVAKILMSPGDTVAIGQVVVQLESVGGAVVAEAQETARKDATPHLVPQPTPVQKPQTTPPIQPEMAHERRAVARPPGAAVAASPAVRRLARELGVELRKVNGTGTGGRISADDVKQFVRDALSGALATGPEKSPKLPDFDKFGSVKRQELSKVRRITGEILTMSWAAIPHVTQHDKADVTYLEEFRRNAASRVEEKGGKLTVTAILAKVCAAALAAYPRFNSSLDWPNRELIVKSYINIGIAVDTERGLIVPVVRDADKKSLTELAIEIQDLATRTRDKKVKPDELEGGNFTISNLGGIGGTAFTPIVYAPQVAILGVARTQIEVRKSEGKLEELKILPLALSYDHRVIDGAEGARFTRWIVEALENPYLAVLGA